MSDTTEQLTPSFFIFLGVEKIILKTRQIEMILKNKIDKELEAFQAFPVNK